jgi:uncharacterized membrane protein YqjE
VEEPLQSAGEGPIGRLLSSAGEFCATLVTIVRTRIELATTELQLELRRVAGLAVWTAVAVVSGAFSLLMAGVVVIIAFWDEHRLLAAVVVTAAYVLLTGIAAAMIARSLRPGRRMFDATLTELARDGEQLRRKGS